MPVSIHWDNPEKTIIYFTFEGKWTLEELYAVLDEQQKMMASIDHTAHAIVDVRDSSILPSNILSIRSRQDRMTPKNQGISVVVGGGRFVTVIANMYQQLANHEVSIHFTENIDDARKMITAELARASSSS